MVQTAQYRRLLLVIQCKRLITQQQLEQPGYGYADQAQKKKRELLLR